MWIMLNNKPFDLSKIRNISEVIELSTDYIKNSRERYEDLFPYNSFDENCKKEISKCVTNNEKRVFGYFFKISIIVYIQCYLNGSSNGIKQNIENKYSNIYETREEAQGVLENFLLETNDFLNNLLKINI